MRTNFGWNLTFFYEINVLEQLIQSLTYFNAHTLLAAKQTGFGLSSFFGVVDRKSTKLNFAEAFSSRHEIDRFFVAPTECPD